jgi:hypothetical protein
MFSALITTILVSIIVHGHAYKIDIASRVTAKDNNDLADQICKGRCKHLVNNCGKIIGCGNEQFDVSKHCPVTCNVACEDKSLWCAWYANIIPNICEKEWFIDVDGKYGCVKSCDLC